MWRHVRGFVGSAGIAWRAVLSWAVWRSRRVWVSAAAAVLVAGTVPVVLVVAGGHDATPVLFHLPRPGAHDLPGASPTFGDPSTPTVGPTTGAVGKAPTTAPASASSSVVVSLRDPANTAAITSRGATVVGEIVGTGFVKVRPSGDPAALVAALQRDPAVAAVSLDYGRRTSAVPNDEFYGPYQQSYLGLTRMPEAWDRVTNASSQVVAVVDTGVDAGHPDLAGRLVGGFNAVAPGSAPSDVDGHGTFVAGVIAANANNGTGVAGVTWNGRVMPIKVFAGPLAFDSDIAAGIVWAVDHGARVINLSLGGPGFSPLLHVAVQYATDRNVVVVAASGNEGNDVPQYPAAFDEVLAVGAIDPDGKLVDFSSYGDWLDLAAPGWGVVSTWPGSVYAGGDGTSFATPVVSGVAALVRAQNPALNQTQVGDRLRAAARDAGPYGIDPYYGFGVLDAARALGAPFAADLTLPQQPHGIPDNAPSVEVGTSRTDTIDVEGDAHWYSVRSASTQTVTVKVDTPNFSQFSPQNLDPVLEIFNVDFERIAFADSLIPTADESANAFIEAGRSIYVRVHNYNGSADRDPYILTITAAVPAVPYDVEVVPTGVPVKSLAVGDLTGDGRADLAYATGFSSTNPDDANKLFVRIQQPDRSLAPPVRYDRSVSSPVIVDVDQDGRDDLVTLTNTLTWFRQDETGQLVSQPVLATIDDFAQFVAPGDLDGDGDSDFVVLGLNKTIVLMHGSGSAFTSSVLPDVIALHSPIDITLGDVDGDGADEVVYTRGQNVRVHHYATTGWTFTDYPGASALANMTMAAIGDVTGDGRHDIIATVSSNSPGGIAEVFAQNADGTLAAPITYDAGQIPQSPEAGDIDGDGRLDVAMINNAFGSVTILHQQQNGTLGGKETIPISMMQHPGGHGLGIADLDGDGLKDIVSVGDSALTIIRHKYHVGEDLGVVRAVAPWPHATGVALGTAVQVLAGPVDPSTVNSDTVRLVDGQTGVTIASSVAYDIARTILLTPSAPLDRAKPYRFVLDGVRMPGGAPLEPFASTFYTTGTGPMGALRDFAVRGQVGTAASVSATVPVGDLGDVIVRYAVGTTPPASPTAGSAGYQGPAGGVGVGGLTPGQTYSFAVWYRDRAGNLSPRSTATLVGTTVAMGGVSTGGGGAGPTSVTFTGSVSTPAGAGVGVPVPLVAVCAEGSPTGEPVGTATGTASGGLSLTLPLGEPRCVFRWEITNSTQYMGGASVAVRVTGGGINPPVDPTPPRQR